ncbi:unnamed protein product [Rhizophagus irregularis]|nr:unnamed protein product [Rhizophagus irregularis]
MTGYSSKYNIFNVLVFNITPVVSLPSKSKQRNTTLSTVVGILNNENILISHQLTGFHFNTRNLFIYEFYDLQKKLLTCCQRSADKIHAYGEIR